MKFLLGLVCCIAIVHGCKTTSHSEQEPTGETKSVRLLKKAIKIIKAKSGKQVVVELNRNKLMDLAEMNIESLNEYLRVADNEINIKPLTTRSTDEEIKEAYHALVKVFHPDKVPRAFTDDAHKITIDIKKNYEELIDRIKKHNRSSPVATP